MVDQLLNYFTSDTYPLTLVYDPDRLLEDEYVLTTLVKRGFQLVFEPDPIHFRYKIEKLKPFSVEKPIIIRTEKTLNEMPYDIWHQGHHVQLSLHTFFPAISYPVIQQLTPSQIWRLSSIQSPPKNLGYEGTVRFVLKEVFGIDVAQLQQPDYFLLCLSEYHHQPEPMAKIFIEFFIKQINAIPSYASWPIPEIITNKDRFLFHLQNLWEEFINQKKGTRIGEQRAPYYVNFDESDLMQLHLAKMVQVGQIQPVRIMDNEELPNWIKPGVIEETDNVDLRRFEQLELSLSIKEPENINNYLKEDWQQLAYEWAEFTVLRYKPDLKLEPDQKLFYEQKRDEINAAFLSWLREKYSYLGGRQLPVPHHLYHVPHYLAYERSKKVIDRIALLVMDGMALADWKVIHKTWRNRHKNWDFDEKLLIAQLPTITAISRQALISGLRPMEFADSIKDNRKEPKLWVNFWEKHQVAGTEVIYDRLPKNIRMSNLSWIDKPRLKIVCMVKNNLDDMIHNSLHGSKGFFKDLELWLEGDSHNLENILEKLLNKGFSIFVTSDHGHIEATGFGKITDEGLTVETRSKRARVYNDYNFASQNQNSCSPSFLWQSDGLLPEDIWALMPERNQAYISENEIAVAHGGASIEEVIVPFVKIEKSYG